MTAHWIVGTAGHIDHGKTSLVKALTGQNTDRLKEEQERGISIELGFAHLDLPGGIRAGVVDVPGHERFVRTMLAGAHGMDLVLFTVAADDGVMPQTVEHLDILHLLGVERAIFVITKADLASESRIREVTDEIRALTDGTSLQGSPAVPFSFVSGEGLADLRAQIVSVLAQGTKPEPHGTFRLPVDRAFASPGHGRIVTGTAISGEVRPGDRVRCLPGGDVVRVRSVEAHNEAAEVGTWGQRLALNLTGATRSPIGRGDTICHEAITLTCDRFDARLEVRPGAPNDIKSYQRVRVHIGTAERLGRVMLFGSAGASVATLAPGQRAYCQIELTEPVLALRGDRFIVRDETAQRTIAGGAVVWPASPKHKRSDPGLAARLEAFDRGDDHVIVESLANENDELVVSLARLALVMNHTEKDVQARLAIRDDVHAFRLDADVQYALEDDCRRAKTSIVERVSAWHAAHPLSPGMDIEEARAGCPKGTPARIVRMLVQELETEGVLAREGPLLRLADHRVQVPSGDQALVARIHGLLGRAPLAPPDLKQLADELAIERPKLIALMRALEKQHAVVSVAPDLFFSAETIDRVRTDLVRDLSVGDGLTTAAFRDRYQTSRKYAIPLLEYFDRVGLTFRTGEVRRLKRPRLTENA